MEASKLGLYFDEFVVGETVEHALSKTIFESDNNFFSLLTMNHHPVHTNQIPHSNQGKQCRHLL